MIRIKPFAEFTMTLHARSSSGYLWSPLHIPYSFLELTSVSTVALPNYQGCTQYFVFRATNKLGTTSITMQYKRPWDASPTKVYKEEVQVEW